MKENYRLQIKDLSFENLLRLFPHTKEISFTLYFKDFLFLTKDKEEIIKVIEEEFEESKKLYLLSHKKEDFDLRIDDYIKEAGYQVEENIDREKIIRNTKVKELKNKLFIMHSIHHNRREYLAIDDHELFDFVYAYLSKKMALELNLDDKKATNPLDLLNDKLLDLKQFIYKYKIRIKSDSLLSAKVKISYFMKLDTKSIHEFLKLNNGDNLNIIDISLYNEKGKMIFGYDYQELMYFLDDEWHNIGGTLAN